MNDFTYMASHATAKLAIVQMLCVGARMSTFMELLKSVEELPLVHQAHHQTSGFEKGTSEVLY